MITVYLLVGLIVLALLGLFAYGLLGPREPWDYEQSGGLLSSLQQRRDRLLRSLKDLEFEHEAGTLAEAEYREASRDIKRRTIDVMKTLDRVRAARSRRLGRKGESMTSALRHRVERLVAQKRKEAS